MQVPYLNVYVGEEIPVRYSFLRLLQDFESSTQSLTGASIVWSSQSPLLAAFVPGTESLVSSDQGIADGIPNDTCMGNFDILTPGLCTIEVRVDAINPTATYVGVVKFQIEGIPTP